MLWVHGHYRRWAVLEGERRRIYVLRYRCRHCGATPSVLPGICLPYRSQNALQVMEYIARVGEAGRGSVPRYEEELRGCERIWGLVYVMVLAVLGGWLPRGQDAPREVMERLLQMWPQPGACQQYLLERHGVSLLGHYRIHDWARKSVGIGAVAGGFDSS